MNKLTNLLVMLGLAALIGCGGNDNKNKMDAAPPMLDGPVDAMPNTPAPPTLGAQIDRMGRPAINTALNHTFDVDAATKAAAKDAYNADEGEGNWGSAYGAEFAKNLAILDALDSKSAIGGGTPVNGCGNQILYNGNTAGGSAATATSYATAAAVLADDQLYVDTSKSDCEKYLGVELDYLQLATGDCGGRTLTEDVIDVSYSALAAGTAGFDSMTLTPLIGDGVSAHGDLSATFPFLGTPH